ncbi:MAG: sortase [Candidatus Pacebacteria bacterium]|nr:sortase [Candidatus Paceibacterota bacterium]
MIKNDTPKHRRITSRPWEFLAIFLIVFFVVSVFLFAIDFVPESPTSSNTANVAEASVVTLSASEPIRTAESLSATKNAVAPVAHAIAYASDTNAPLRVTIPKVGIDTPVNNPNTTTVSGLDSALLKGAVRYPTSALLGESAPMLIFGHQSYLPVVKNQAFKAFNSLQNVRAGDDVIVSSATTNYHYRVTSISYVDAGDAEIQIGGGARTLTLVTCDSFGKQKTKRYVVEAEFTFEEPITTTRV